MGHDGFVLRFSLSLPSLTKVQTPHETPTEMCSPSLVRAASSLPGVPHLSWLVSLGASPSLKPLCREVLKKSIFKNFSTAEIFQRHFLNWFVHNCAS